jgi:hypothetical protein
VVILRIRAMALRTSMSEVRELLQDEDAKVFIFIQVANDIVDTSLLGSGLSDRILTRIESFLACHLYLLSNPELAAEAYDTARYQYVQAKVDEGFRATKWGQMAIALDSTGVLLGANQKRVALHIL